MGRRSDRAARGLGWARAGVLLAVAQMGDEGLSRRALDAVDASPQTQLRMMASEVERLRSRVMSLRGRRPSAVTPGLAGHAGLASLTLREAEVASLVAGRRSSKEVALHLDVSVRTIDKLLARVYRKLGVAGRADLRDLRSG